MRVCLRTAGASDARRRRLPFRSTLETLDQGRGFGRGEHSLNLGNVQESPGARV